MNLLPRWLPRASALMLGLAWVALWTPSAFAAVQPLTVKELSLMLRSGYTGDDVLRETAGRPLLAPLTEADEKTLLQAGADARFLAAFKAAHPPLPDDEAAAARQRQAEANQRNLEAWENNQAHLLDVHRQAAQSALQARRQMNEPRLADRLRGLLFTCQPNGLKPYEDATLAEKKTFAFYFAALTSPACAQFTPKLVQFYRDYAPQHPSFEVVFVSTDRSAYNQENHMRQQGMPWPALGFDQKAQMPALATLEKQGVPRLLVVDEAGHAVADSVVDGRPGDPQKVLDALLHPPTVSAAGAPPP